MNIFQQFIQHWKYDFKHNKILFWLESSGTVVSMMASALVAGYAHHPPMFVIFVLWLYGSVAMATSFYIRRDGSAMLLMIWYTFINVTGLINLLF